LGDAVNPLDHCAINLALYGDAAQRWTMTERSARQVQCEPGLFQVGPSALRWRDGGLEIDICEWAVPLPRPVRGRIRVEAAPSCRYVTALDEAGRHRWGPILPSTRIEVNFDAPALRWQGHAYLDSNEGDEPIDAAFSTWDWSRSVLADGSTAVIYDVRSPRAGGADRVIAQRFWPNGHSAAFEPPARKALPRTGWRVQRAQRSDSPPQLLRGLEDAPFYARAMLRAELLGEQALTMHETLNAQRLKHWAVQRMLPFRMPRRP
jgi:carotenoid 1,2-hydratase